MKPISLIGNSGIQFVDVNVDLSEGSDALRTSGIFCEKTVQSRDGKSEKKLLFPELDETGTSYLDPKTNETIPEDQTFTVTARQALECFEGHWVPIPYFRQEAYSDRMKSGPTTWSRLWFASHEMPNRSSTHRVVLAFDTASRPAADKVYYAPTHEDVNGSLFKAVVDPHENLSFLRHNWVQQWLEHIYLENKKRLGFEYHEEYFIFVGLYLTLLRTLHRANTFAPVTLNSSEASVEVDLILDVGNSRSCGLLLETARNQETFSFANSSRLEIRDLSQPSLVYNDPFEMVCEFSKTELGIEAAAGMSGRSDAFVWPSLVRVGFEAARLSVINDSTTYYTGISSPKRYLWDEKRRGRPWSFNMAQTGDSAPEPALNDFSALFQEDGKRITDEDSELPGLNPTYSRSSIMCFALSEIILHAISQINSHRFRTKHGATHTTRRLKRVVLTCPTAMTEMEKTKLRRHADDAVKALKTFYGHQVIDPDLLVIPSPTDTYTAPNKTDWGYDEATCVQLAYLYGEIRHRMRDDVDLYFNTVGRRRKDTADPEQPSITIASLDIGGGTTDLMICSYQRDPKANTAVLIPKPLFWEGFDLAGDTILKRIIERLVLPVIRERAEELGGSRIADAMLMLFGPDHANQSALAKARRKQFARQIAVPIALGMLRHAVSSDATETQPYDDFFLEHARPLREVVEHINARMRQHGAADFEIEQISWPVSTEDINKVVRSVVQRMLGALCGVISQFDCDYLLLAGRPTMLPVVREILLQYLPVPPDRIVLLGRYRIGNWYPFSEANGVISDPKTCVSVGAAIGLMGGSLVRLEGFRLETHPLKEHIGSTARFIGSYKVSQSAIKNVFFDDSSGSTATFQFDTPMLIGMRQMDSDEWLAKPMYKVTYSEPGVDRQLANRLPLEVTIRRSDLDIEDIKSKPVSIIDRNGQQVPNDKLIIRPQTLVDEDGYWLDTGVFELPIF